MTSEEGTPARKAASRAAQGRSMPLPVLDRGVSGAEREGPSVRGRYSRRRVVVLLLVQLLMIVHVVHWAITGKSLGRFVLSDSMRTLELGEVNPGFLLFAASLLVTVVFGRFMCGWVCHMGALQDLAAWLLRGVGVRPRVFRSRLLGFVPLVLAGYMFVWPTLKREILHGWATAALPAAADLLKAPAFPGLSWDMTTGQLWEGLPPWWVATPFLLVCGFGTVYFLGARGLCRYGCPYGGFLLPAEQASVGRVVVDPSRCDQCGLCTAACTAGVRVHDDVREFGAVVDRHCVRSLDCVAACPSGALRFGFAVPAALRRCKPGRKAYDLTVLEEIVCAAAFTVAFLGLRGIYDLVPMLLATTLAVLASFVTWKLLRVFRETNVRMGWAQLRLKGALTAWGRVFLAGGALMWMAVLHCAAVQVCAWRAHAADDRVTAGFDAVMGGAPASAADLRSAAEAEGWYALLRTWGRGGVALVTSPEGEVRRAWMRMVQGDLAGGEAILRDASTIGPSAAVQLARFLLAGGRTGEGVTVLERASARFPADEAVRDLLAVVWARMGKQSEAEALYLGTLAARPDDAGALMGLGRVLVMEGRVQEGLDRMKRVSSDWPRNAGARQEYALTLYSLGRAAEAVAELDGAGRARPAYREHLAGLASRIRDAIEHGRSGK